MKNTAKNSILGIAKSFFWSYFYTLVSTFLLCSFTVFSQVNNEANIGFEKGDLSGWTFTNGTVSDPGGVLTYSSERPDVTGSRKFITSTSSGNDPNITQEAIPRAYPKSRYSLKLGNSENGRGVGGGSFEKAKTTFLVTNTDNLFQYYFCVFLREDFDTRHKASQKPGFSIKVKDKDGVVIKCGDFDVQLENKLINGFKRQGDIDYRNWTTGAIDLRLYVGQYLTVEVLVHGCTGRGHLGYCYFDAELKKTEINPLTTCPNSKGELLFAAPEGFETYAWTGGGGNQTALIKGNVGQTINVKVVPFSSLDAACGVTINYTIKKGGSGSRTVNASLCEGESITLGDKKFDSPGQSTYFYNMNGVCDSTYNLTLSYSPIIREAISLQKCVGESVMIADSMLKTSGNYTFQIKRPQKCDSVLTASIVFNKLETSSSVSDSIITLGASVNLSHRVIAGDVYASSWEFNGSRVCSDCISQNFTPDISGELVFQATNMSATCTNIEKFKIWVFPECEVMFPTIFTPNDNSVNDYFYPISGECIDKIPLFQIYNRWGALIFEKKDALPNNPDMGWNGMIKSQMAPTGVYLYTASYLKKTGAKGLKSGSILLQK
ncbi:MAG: gliding motility-associated C-terminal domain-containing protein [Leadbetterella sp.]